jgi:hypothetical protein
MPQQEQEGNRQAAQDNDEQLDRELTGGRSGGSKNMVQSIRHRRVISLIAAKICSLNVLVKGAGRSSI